VPLKGLRVGVTVDQREGAPVHIASTLAIEEAFDASTPAGALCPDWAERLGLPSGIPVAIGAFDVHYGAIGCGVAAGTLVKVIGTSTCDCAVMPGRGEIPSVPGICGIVDGSILPGFLGVEAGQSAVGDLFKWWVEGICGGEAALHGELTDTASALRPGQSGLLALDWNNGNRTVLVDQRLTGLILGQTLRTTPAEIYRQLHDTFGCLGAHMLEICPSIAAARPRCEIHPLGIGGKADPVRLVFDAATGPALNASLVDLGNRFRLLVNTVESVPLPRPMPKLPVARVLWDAKPELATAAEAWIQAGGAHHTAFSFDVSVEQIETLAAMAGVECVVIDEQTEMRRFGQDLRVGEVYYGIKGL